MSGSGKRAMREQQLIKDSHNSALKEAINKLLENGEITATKVIKELLKVQEEKK